MSANELQKEVDNLFDRLNQTKPDVQAAVVAKIKENLLLLSHAATTSPRKSSRAKRVNYARLVQADPDDASEVDNPSVKTFPLSQTRKVMHRRKRTEAEYVCDVCKFRCAHRSQLVTHKRRHTGETPYACSECGKKFNQSSTLNVHLKRHRGQRDFACKICPYKSFTKIDLVRHCSTHTGERNHVCQHCGKAFSKDSTLREHIKCIHDRTRQYHCPECSFSTYRSSNLGVHIRMRHHGVYNNHVCPVCGARLKQRQAFLDHVRKHTGERPFGCNFCESSFATRTRLNVHVRSVHQPRSFCCAICRKTFQTKHHLERHELTHTNAKPYSCPFCSYACNAQGNITKHVKTVHNRTDFSFRRFRRGDEKPADPTWVAKGEKLTEEYLKQLSEKLGKEVTVDELKMREAERARLFQEELLVKRQNRAKASEHSYHAPSTEEAKQEIPLVSVHMPEWSIENVEAVFLTQGQSILKNSDKTVVMIVDTDGGSEVDIVS